MWNIIATCATVCSLSAPVPAGAERLAFPLDASRSAHVLHNTLVEPLSASLQIIDQGVTHGGEWHTDVLEMLITDQARPRDCRVAWIHTETRNSLSLAVFGILQPRVVDAKLRDETLIILYVGDDQFRLAFVGQDEESWHELRTRTVDVSALAAGQERVGLVGRIVTLDDRYYVHVRHRLLPAISSFASSTLPWKLRTIEMWSPR